VELVPETELNGELEGSTLSTSSKKQRKKSKKKERKWRLSSRASAPCDEGNGEIIVEGGPIPDPPALKWYVNPLTQYPALSVLGFITAIPVLLLLLVLGITFLPILAIPTLILAGCIWVVMKLFHHIFEFNIAKPPGMREIGEEPASEPGIWVNPFTRFSQFYRQAKKFLFIDVLLGSVSTFLKLFQNDDGMDIHTRLLWVPVKSGIDSFVATPTSDIPLASEPPNTRLEVWSVKEGIFHVACHDEDDPGRSDFTFAIMQFLHDLCPHFDSTKYFGESNADGDAAELRLREDILHGDYLPSTNVHWGNTERLRSDLAMSLHAFQGLMAMYVVKRVPGEPLHPTIRDDPNEEYVVDHDAVMDRYEVRGDFKRYGGVMFFDKDREITRICFRKRDRNAGFVEVKRDPQNGRLWNHMKFAVRSAAFLRMTQWEHLEITHFVFANSVMLATRRILYPTHPIRRFVKVFTFRTAVINKQAQATLFPDGGTLVRAVAYTNEAFTQMLKDGKAEAKWTTFPDELERRGFGDMVYTPKSKTDQIDFAERKDNDEYPYGQDGIDFWNVCHMFVKSYFEKAYVDKSVADDPATQAWWDDLVTHVAPELMRDHPKLPGGQKGADLLINFLTAFLFQVTGYHEHGGNVGEYVLNPTMMAPKLRDGDVVGTIQGAFQMALVTALTGLRMPPLMGDFSLHFSGYQDIYHAFKSNLDRLSYKIEQRNLDRRQPLYSFSPRFLEISVSI